ncbi:type II toxin-antitoxin system MqsA family antitoxin [Perlucidibaca piscinae]|uniref:type II toxin-antitoxin system MqsA family antitoxin n=1 Tax=Perlucidibaca piscinae TaxID=392589 RepID=UPI0003B4BF31|nr:type II toxin-antitoxin system MqsA family antitoxin [Perlucidibaca piscinae]
MTQECTSRFCLQCDDGTELAHEARDLKTVIDGLPFTVAAVSGWHCPVCGEVEFDAGEGARFSAALTEARGQVTERKARVIREIRRQLKLTQAEAGLIFGGGASAFSEYERGRTQPHKSTWALMRILGKHPELLNELR